MSIDCYVDADFAGLWGFENPHDPTSVKSRTGYVLCLAGCSNHLDKQITIQYCFVHDGSGVQRIVDGT